MTETEKREKLNLHQKMLKIAAAAGVLQRTKEAYGYKYVPEEDIQAKVTGAMQEYGVMLYNELIPGTLRVEPYTYIKEKMVCIKKESKDSPAQYEKHSTNVNEIIVSADSIYTWVNADNPEEQKRVPWAIVGQMDDASQAFGAGCTYCNRYNLMKTLQLATTEADPDSYRAKQKEAAVYEEKKKQDELNSEIDKLMEVGRQIIETGVIVSQIQEIVSKHNDGNANARSIKTIETCKAVIAEVKKLKPLKQKPTAAVETG